MESAGFHPEITKPSNVEAPVATQESLVTIENTEENTVTEIQASRPQRNKNAPARYNYFKKILNLLLC